MNFLLHRHFANRELDSQVAGVGAMLPDLWRMAHRGMRAQNGVTDASSPLALGVAHHLEADRWFHRTDVFKRGERALARELASVGVPKLVLFAHPTWEMCLDGALLSLGDFDSSLAQLREGVESAASGFDEVAALHGAAALDDRARFRSRLAQIVRGLTDGRWIASYRTGLGLAQCVGGMRKRFGLPAFSEEDESVVACILDEALDRAHEALPRLFTARYEHRLEAAS